MQKLDVQRLRALSKTLKQALKDKTQTVIIVHMGTCGIASGAERILEAVRECAQSMGSKKVVIKTSGCAGFCSREPMVTVELPHKPPVKYADLTPSKVRKIYEQHVLKGEPVREYVLGVGCERVH